MNAKEPQELPVLLEQALNSGDADRVASLYEPDAVIVPRGGEPARGRDAIRAMTASFLGQGPRFVLHDFDVAESADVALITASWSFTVRGEDGSVAETAVAPRLVARRQGDGSWLIVIDRPELQAGNAAGSAE